MAVRDMADIDCQRLQFADSPLALAHRFHAALCVETDDEEKLLPSTEPGVLHNRWTTEGGNLKPTAGPSEGK